MERATHVQGGGGSEDPAGRIDQKQIRRAEVRVCLNLPRDIRGLSASDAAQDIADAGTHRVAEVRDILRPGKTKDAKAME